MKIIKHCDRVPWEVVLRVYKKLLEKVLHSLIWIQGWFCFDQADVLEYSHVAFQNNDCDFIIENLFTPVIDK